MRGSTMISRVFAEVAGSLGRCWRSLALADLACKLIAFVLLAPLVTVLLRLFMAGSGATWLTDEEILFFVVSPLGITAIATAATVIVAITFVELSALMTVCIGASQQGCPAWTTGLRFTASRWRGIAGLAGQIVARLLLIAAPFLAGVGVVYLVFLTEYDINYYLAEKPPDFWKALALAGASGAALAVLLIRSLIRWSISLPIVLFEGKKPAEALSLSAARTAGNRGRIAILLVGWLSATLLASAVATGIMGLLGRAAALGAGISFAVLAVAIGALLSLNAAVLLLLSVLAVAGTSAAAVSLYRVLAESAGVSLPTLPLEIQQSPGLFPVRSKARLAALAGAVLLAFGFSFYLFNDLKGEDDVLIAAHRGSSGAAPENTLAAVALALEEGADFVEIDVQETADGVIVVLHDADLMRLAGVRLNIWDADYADLRDIDVGSRFSPEFSDERIPTLKEVLEMVRGRARLNIELKYNGHDVSLAERVVEAVEAAKMESEVVLMSLSYGGVRELKTLRPDWEVGFLSAAAVGRLAKIEADFLAVSTRLATTTFISSAHRAGKKVHVWTVNDRLGMSEMMDRGVDVIITDEPALGRSVLAERAGLTPVERLLVRFGALLRFDQTTLFADDA
jgi:glycerophosphoryl diester phosphodiesterase